MASWNQSSEILAGVWVCALDVEFWAGEQILVLSFSAQPPIFSFFQHCRTVKQRLKNLKSLTDLSKTAWPQYLDILSGSWNTVWGVGTPLLWLVENKNKIKKLHTYSVCGHEAEKLQETKWKQFCWICVVDAEMVFTALKRSRETKNQQLWFMIWKMFHQKLQLQK